MKNEIQTNNRQEFLSAIIQAQSAIAPITKDKTNPHFKNDYVSLATILKAVCPILNLNKILLTQEIGIDDKDRDILKTRLTHISGEELSSSAILRVKKSDDINDPQKFASSLTYMRRYSLTALLGIAEEDDDGNEASTPSAQSKPKEIIKTINPKQLEEIQNLIDEAKMDKINFCELVKINSLAEIPQDKFVAYVARLKTKISEKKPNENN